MVIAQKFPMHSYEHALSTKVLRLSGPINGNLQNYSSRDQVIGSTLNSRSVFTEQSHTDKERRVDRISILKKRKKMKSNMIAYMQQFLSRQVNQCRKHCTTEAPRVCYQRFCCKIEIAIIKKLGRTSLKHR